MSVFKRYARARDGMLSIAVYTEMLLPFDAVQMRLYDILGLRKNWRLIGAYTDDSSIGNNKNDFKKLLKLYKKIDMILCSSQEHLLEKTKLVNEMGIPKRTIQNDQTYDILIIVNKI